MTKEFREALETICEAAVEQGIHPETTDRVWGYALDNKDIIKRDNKIISNISAFEEELFLTFCGGEDTYSCQKECARIIQSLVNETKDIMKNYGNK